MNAGKEQVSIIRPSRGWELINLRELLEYRDLFYFLVWKDIKAMYAQTILGFGWAILQPLIQILIFTIIFGKVAKIPTDGIPYFLFATVAIIPWTYMSTSMSLSGLSLITGQNMLGKVYFPRLIYPVTPVLTKLVDFGISLLIIVAVMVYYQVAPTMQLLYLPLFILMMMCVPMMAGLWLSSLSIRFRDVRFAMQFVIRMLMYSAPIVYTASSIPETYRFFYSLNPIVGVIEGFRASLLGLPMPWEYIVPGLVVCIIGMVGGALYFKRMERVIVDVI